MIGSHCDNQLKRHGAVVSRSASRVARCVVYFHKQSLWIFSGSISHYDVWAQEKTGAMRSVSMAVPACKRNDGGVSALCWFHLGCSAIIQRGGGWWGREGKRGGVVERHHFTPPIPLRHHWNIIRCLLTFKSCSAAVISIGPAAISVKCPLATRLLHMEGFFFFLLFFFPPSPSVVSLLHFAPSLHLAFYSAAWLRWRVGTSRTKEMSHHRRCCWSRRADEKTLSPLGRGVCLRCTVFGRKKDLQ